MIICKKGHPEILFQEMYVAGKQSPCPICTMLKCIREILQESKDIQLSLSQYGISRQSQMNVNKIDLVLKS
jgi:hypothetical protein